MTDASGSAADKSVQVKLVLLGTFLCVLRYHGSDTGWARRYYFVLTPELNRRSCCRKVFSGLTICMCSSTCDPLATRVHLFPQVSNEFQANKEPTIGAAFLTQKCRLEDRVLRYEIWDTAGQERFHSLAVSPDEFPDIIDLTLNSPCSLCTIAMLKLRSLSMM